MDGAVVIVWLDLRHCRTGTCLPVSDQGGIRPGKHRDAQTHHLQFFRASVSHCTHVKLSGVSQQLLTAPDGSEGVQCAKPSVDRERRQLRGAPGAVTGGVVQQCRR